jgi:hypothetical protein
MLAIEGGIYVYDLELTNAGVVTRLIMGSATVRSEVTKNV